MSNFQDRKQLRIAAGNQTYRFNVVCRSVSFCGEIAGSFSTRKAAEEFAFSQVTCFAGDTAAYRVISARNIRTQLVPTSLYFAIDRITESETK